MGEYRIEVSPNKRAGCTDTVCKQGEVKIQKGELRFGSWTVIKEHGSWRWKHWGCVSGSQLVNLQEACGGDPDNLDFDAIDGFDELQDEELKEKVKRCVRQGHIDPEDFNGDPEKNKPGEKGIHLTAKQKEAKEKAAALEAGESQSAASQKDTKRGRKKAADDVADEPEPKKARKSKDIDADEEQPKTKAKARVKGEDNVKKPASLKRGRPRRSSVQQDEEVESEEAEKPAPAKRVAKRGSKAKATKAAATTNEDESGAKYTPVSSSRGRKRTAVVPQAEEQDEETPKAVAKRGRKAASAKKANPDGVEGAEEEAPKPRGRGRPRKSV